MDSRTGVGEIVDASSSYFWQNRHSMYTDQEGGGLIFEGKQVYVVCCFVLLIWGWNKSEMMPPVALGTGSELSAFTMSLAPPVHPSPIFLTDTENL